MRREEKIKLPYPNFTGVGREAGCYNPHSRPTRVSRGVVYMTHWVRKCPMPYATIPPQKSEQNEQNSTQKKTKVTYG